MGVIKIDSVNLSARYSSSTYNGLVAAVATRIEAETSTLPVSTKKTDFDFLTDFRCIFI